MPNKTKKPSASLACAILVCLCSDKIRVRPSTVALSCLAHAILKVVIVGDLPLAFSEGDFYSCLVFLTVLGCFFVFLMCLNVFEGS